MKLELKHLAGYLPYNLQMQHKHIKAKHRREDKLRPWVSILEPLKLQVMEKYFEWLPILRPLSDLTKEIEVNGEKFVPYINLAKKYAEMSGYNEDIRIYRNKCYCYSKSSEIEFRFNGRDFILNGKLVNAQYHLFLKLHEWHFDIYGLIEKGLAINKNTIQL